MTYLTTRTCRECLKSKTQVEGLLPLQTEGLVPWVLFWIGGHPLKWQVIFELPVPLEFCIVVLCIKFLRAKQVLKTGW